MQVNTGELWMASAAVRGADIQQPCSIICTMQNIQDGAWTRAAVRWHPNHYYGRQFHVNLHIRVIAHILQIFAHR
jgi:hypothetical protein